CRPAVELMASRQNDDDGDTITAIKEDHFMENFFYQCEEIRSSSSKICQYAEEVKENYIIMFPALHTEGGKLHHHAEDVKENCTIVLKKLKSTEQSFDQNESELHFRRTHNWVLSELFMETMAENNQSHSLFWEHSWKAVGGSPGQELEDILESSETYFICNIISDSQITRQALDEITSPHKDIVKLETRVCELHDTLMVETQGEMINNVEKNVLNATDYGEHDKGETKAVKHHSKARRIVMWIIILVIILFVMVRIILAMTSSW
uniref:t-SNARE coiled-coil homology domain-containing protein n=1 Tax=Otolemur garnettii TaxID=30611 RepID=H0Y0Y0_OTOGA